MFGEYIINAKIGVKMTNRHRAKEFFGSYLKLLIATLVLLLAMLPTNVIAATPAPPSASGLSISPLRTQLTLSPGQSSALTVTLKNITGGPVEAIPTVRDFTADNVDGNPKIITNPNVTSPSSIKSFLSPVPKIALAVGQQKTFTIEIHMPSDVSPGAYFGLIEYQAIPANNGATNTGNSKVALTAAVSQLVFITVPGNVTQIMQVKSIDIYHDKQGTSGGFLFTSPPRAVGVDMSNLANAFEQPYGTVQVENMNGKVVDSYQLNNGVTRGIVLPYSDRIFINEIKGVSTPGPYTVIASITYGKGGSAILVAKKTFWYIPMWIIIVVLVILLILIAAVTLAYRRYKNSGGTGYRRQS